MPRGSGINKLFRFTISISTWLSRLCERLCERLCATSVCTSVCTYGYTIITRVCLCYFTGACSFNDKCTTDTRDSLQLISLLNKILQTSDLEWKWLRCRISNYNVQSPLFFQRRPLAISSWQLKDFYQCMLKFFKLSFITNLTQWNC